jgi:hypothetical protein
MLKRDTHPAVGTANSSLEASATTQAESADAPSASPNDATVTTPASIRHRTQMTWHRRRRQRLRIVMQLLARLQHPDAL